MAYSVYMNMYTTNCNVPKKYFSWKTFNNLKKEYFLVLILEFDNYSIGILIVQEFLIKICVYLPVQGYNFSSNSNNQYEQIIVDVSS